MVKNTWSTVILCVLLMLFACSDDGVETPSTGPSLGLSVPDILGLADGRMLEYSRIDTITTWIPNYDVREDTGTQLISIVGGTNDWIIRDDTVPVINLKISDPYTLHNGYWRKVGLSDALVYFPAPAVMLNRSAAQNQSWEGYVPIYTSDSGEVSRIFYYGYFGFYFSKTYMGTQQVFVPAFGGTTLLYETKLFRNEDDVLPIATITENYAAGIGLVRQELRGEGLIRILSLREYH